MNRLAALHVPRFPLQRLVLEHPSLSGKPIVMHADDRGSQRVRFASAAALKRGLRPGMTVSSASAIVPDLEKRPFELEAERAALISLGERLMVASPAFEVDAPEGLWLDASAAHLAGGEALWAKVLLTTLSEAGYRARCAVGSERFTTQALARFGSEPCAVVSSKTSASVAPLPLSALEGWLGAGATEPFRTLGLTTLGEVAGLSSGALVARFGAMGLHAARLCRGDDDSRFSAQVLPERVHERIELDWPAEHVEPLLFAVKTMVDRLCGRLQGRQVAAVQLAVTLVLDSRERMVVPLRLARPSSQSKLLVELIRHRLTDLTVNQPIAALEVVIDEACAERGRQLMLGDAPSGEAELEVVLARLQSALGPDTLFSAVPQAQHRPEDGWVATPFRPPDAGRLSDLWGAIDASWALGTEHPEAAAEEAEVVAPECLEPLPVKPEGVAPMWLPGQASRSDEEAHVTDLVAFIEQQAGQPHIKPSAKIVERPKTAMSTMLARPARLFREPSALQVDVAADGVMRWVTLLGRRRRVESLQGPERVTGAWWAASPFARDYYQVQIEGVGALWVFRDGRDGGFYVQGAFD